MLPKAPIAGARRIRITLAGVVDRADVASWLEGPGPRPGAGRKYPGMRFGMPPAGPGSMGRFGRRFIAVAVDWALCTLIAAALFDVPLVGLRTGAQDLIPLAIFALENVLLVGTAGATVGHRLLGLRVVTLGPGRALFPAAVIRTALLCLVVPAVVWDRDGRGWHDRMAGTVVARR